MQGNKVQILHCKCGLIYMSKASGSCYTVRCPVCSQTPNEIEHLPQYSFSNFKQRLSSMLEKYVIPGALTIVGMVGFAIISPQILPQQVQLPVEPNPSRSPISLPNGTNIIPPQNLEGYGVLTVDNGTDRDAVVKLIDRNSGDTLRFVYVQAKHQVTIENIPPGNCTFRFSTGTDWDRQTSKFLQNPSFSEFIQPLDFQRIQTKDGEKWRTYKVTLHPIFAGNAQTKPIGERDFQNK
ncbi:hypothetical protein ACE1CC_13110 [Aerosakkonemataceae cyanobacterium BLCC-F46]|uniref:Uncharacterized protein n=2 Tax=Floridanema TaxID=3396149 RepID=A0ABV4X4S1_9CYAN